MATALHLYAVGIGSLVFASTLPRTIRATLSDKVSQFTHQSCYPLIHTSHVD